MADREVDWRIGELGPEAKMLRPRARGGDIDAGRNGGLLEEPAGGDEGSPGDEERLVVE